MEHFLFDLDTSNNERPSSEGKEQSNLTWLMTISTTPDKTELRVQYEYLWADGKASKPARLSAPGYINTLFDWLEAKVRSRPTAEVPSTLYQSWHIVCSCNDYQ